MTPIICLTTDGRVFLDSPRPGKMRGEPCQHDPEDLKGQSPKKVRPSRFPHINADREIHLIGKWSEGQNLRDSRRKNIEWEEMAAGDVFEGVQDEDEGGNFQHPEGEHGHGVRGKELQQGGQKRGDKKPTQRAPAWRQNKIFTQAQNKNGQRTRSHSEVSQPAGKEEAE